MKRITLLLLLCGASCHAEQTRDVARGWKGDVTSLLTPCRPVATHPTKLVPISATEYEAVAIGTEHFDCGGDRLHMRVSDAVRVVIDLPATVKVGDRHLIRAHGEDLAGHQLDLGGNYVDTYGGVLERV